MSQISCEVKYGTVRYLDIRLVLSQLKYVSTCKSKEKSVEVRERKRKKRERVIERERERKREKE